MEAVELRTSHQGSQTRHRATGRPSPSPGPLPGALHRDLIQQTASWSHSINSGKKAQTGLIITGKVIREKSKYHWNSNRMVLPPFRKLLRVISFTNLLQSSEALSPLSHLRDLMQTFGMSCRAHSLQTCVLVCGRDRSACGNQPERKHHRRDIRPRPGTEG